MFESAEAFSLRRTVYALLITAAAGIAAGRVFGVARLPTATFADNDRSRWATVRALVDDGTYVIGRRIPGKGKEGKPIDLGIIAEDGWQTIDKVLRPDTREFYSSKPPLLATIAAGEYSMLKQWLGLSIAHRPVPVVCTILITLNWLPLVVYLILLAQLVERHGATDWGRLFVMTAACFATLLTAFMSTFNNHTVATCSALFAIYPFLSAWHSDERHPLLFLASGFFAGFTAANELPAAAFLAALFCLLFYRFPLHTLIFFVPGAVIPIAAFLWTNYLAVGQLSPAYSEFGTSWYEYEGSVWANKPGEIKHGIDWAWRTESAAKYAFHLLFGHHGLFSLSPIYVLSLAGGICVLLPGRRIPPCGKEQEPQGGAAMATPNLNLVAVMTLILSTIVIGFYIFGVNERNRNYGGWTNGLRWLMWLTPLWLLTMLPAADWLARRRWSRATAYVLLAISIFSANYSWFNPWRHPWLYELLESKGMINY
jgi:hypothetical protein